VAKITVRVTPRGGRDAIDGYGAGGVLRVRVAAAPAGGSANDSVTRLLAKALGVPPTQVVVVAGASSRLKVIEIEGLSEAAVQTALRRDAPLREPKSV
jgi:uncharacterized protein YggU (UPF0235/DUF167 family)